MSTSDYYMPEAASFRQRTIVMSVLAGAIAGGVFQAMGAGLASSVAACVTASASIQLIAEHKYSPKQTTRKRRAALSLQSGRRYILEAVASVPVFLFFGFLQVPQIEAEVLDRKLREAAAPGAPFGNADQLIQYAIENRIPLKQSTLQELKRKATVESGRQAETPSATDLAQPEVLHRRSQAEKAVSLTLAQIVAYDIYARTSVQLNVWPVALVWTIPNSQRQISMLGSPVSWSCVSLIGQNRDLVILLGAMEGKTNSPAIFRYLGCGTGWDSILAELTFSTAPPEWSSPPRAIAAISMEDETGTRLAVYSAEVIGVTQDLGSILWVDVEFRNCIVTYDRGPLYLNNVRFENCEFRAAANSKTQAILNHLRSVSPAPVTLSHSAPK